MDDAAYNTVINSDDIGNLCTMPITLHSNVHCGVGETRNLGECFQRVWGGSPPVRSRGNISPVGGDEDPRS